MSKTSFRAESLAGPVLIAVAIAGTVLSYMGILRLGLSVGWPIWAAWLLPLAVDGMVVAGILQVLQATAAGTSRKYGWWLTAGGALVSVAANALTATPGILASVNQDILAAATHALPVITVVATLEAWLFMRRGGIHRAAADAATEAREAALTAELAETQATTSATITEHIKDNESLRKQLASLEAANMKLANAGTTQSAPSPGKPTEALPAKATLTAVPALAAAGDRDERVIAMRASGATLGGIAAELRCSVSTVKRILTAATATAAA